MIAQEELPHQHATEVTQQAAEIADQLHFEQPPVQEQELHIHLEHDHTHDHHIETKEGHVCSPDCPEHGSHSHEHEHHHEADHEHEHTITQKTAEHACGPDCPEHGYAHHTHDAKEHKHEHEHHIEQKAHICSPDCPEHGSKHTHEEHHHEHETHHDHQVEQKAHICIPDCPEHSHAHVHQERKHVAEAKESEQHTPHAAEATQPLQNDRYADGMVHYQKIEMTIRQARMAGAEELSAAGQALAQSQAEAVSASIITEAETTAIAAQVMQRELQTVLAQTKIEIPIAEPALNPESMQAEVSGPEHPETLPFVAEPAEAAEPAAQLADDELVTSTDTRYMEAESDALPEPATLETIETIIGSASTDIEPVTEVTGHAEMHDSLEPVETYEPLETIDIKPVELPMPEFMQAVAPTEIDMDSVNWEPPYVEASKTDETVVSSEPDLEQPITIEGAAHILAETISLRIEEIEEQLITAAPKRIQAIQKTLRILAEVQTTAPNERSLEITQQQLMQLLQLLGHEDPSQTLMSYMRLYGVDFTNELLTRLLELLAQGRSFESMPKQGLSATWALPKNGMNALGMLALMLFNLKKGYFILQNSA